MSKRESAPLPEADADAKKLKTSDEAAQDARADNERFCDACRLVHPFSPKDAGEGDDDADDGDDDADDDDDDSDEADDDGPNSSTNLLVKRMYDELSDGADSLVQCTNRRNDQQITRRNARIAIWEADKLMKSLLEFRQALEAEMHNSITQ